MCMLSFGGYMATAINDFIQGIIMLFGICAVIGAVLMPTTADCFRRLHRTLGLCDRRRGVAGCVHSVSRTRIRWRFLFVVILTSLGTLGTSARWSVNSKRH